MKTTTIEILGKQYKVNYADEIGTAGMMGNANRAKQVININTDNGFQQQKETLIHEVLHMIDGELKLDLTEETIARLAVGLYSAGCTVLEYSGLNPVEDEVK